MKLSSCGDGEQKPGGTCLGGDEGPLIVDVEFERACCAGILTAAEINLKITSKQFCFSFRDTRPYEL